MSSYETSVLVAIGRGVRPKTAVTLWPGACLTLKFEVLAIIMPQPFQRFLRQILRVFVADGRVFVGTFVGTDKPLNILLVDTEEYRLDGQSVSEGRYVGQILVPWKIIVKVEATNDAAAMKQANAGYI
jgi:N-alpha-acetyltransferase 38, NatC auxiliary subunit